MSIQDGCGDYDPDRWKEPEGIKLILIWIWQFIKEVKSGDIWIKL